MITFITFKWRPFNGYRSKFTGRQVETLFRMIRRHYHKPFRFICITDEWHDITEPGVEVRELWKDLADVPNPSGRGRNPSCYRRLKVFARNAGEWLGERIVHLDLDAVITGDITEMFDTGETFKIWRGVGEWNKVNGSMWMLETGAHPEIWEDFNPSSSPQWTRKMGCNGSDQGWFAAMFRDPAIWTVRDGVYSFRAEIRQRRSLPAGAKIVFFHGQHDPWDHAVQRIPWVKEHYR